MENQPSISLKHRPNIIDCVDWNQDGQVVVCLDNQVHIITPLLVGLSSKEDSYKHVGLYLPEYKPLLNSDTPVRADQVQTSFFKDEGYRCAKWSETGMSISQSCYLTVVTTKHRVLLYQCSTKDPLNSDWQLYANITDGIEQHAIPHDHPTKINPHHTLYASWSNRVIHNPRATKPSLLALTNKAGDLCIWTVGGEAGGPEYAITISPHTSFVNWVQWTSWKKGPDGNTHIAYLLSSCSNGSVAFSSIQVKSKVDQQNITTLHDIQTFVLFTWFTDKPAFPTFIKIFDDLKNDLPYIRIVVCKGIVLYFLSLTIQDNTVTEERDWILYDLESSALGLSSGTWINEFEFRGYTLEGEGIMFNLTADGELIVDPLQHNLLSGRLVEKYKQLWVEEQVRAEDDDIIGASDGIPYLWGVGDSPCHSFSAVFFSLRPGVDIHYRLEANENTYLTFVLQKARRLDVDSLIDDIDRFVNNPDFFFVTPVGGLIRELLEYLVEDDNTTSFEKWLTKLQYYMGSRPTLDGRELTTAIYCESSTIASRIITNAQIEMKNYRLLTYEEEFDIICDKAQKKTLSHYVAYVFHFALQLSDDKFMKFSDQDKMVLLLLADFSLSLGPVQQTLEVYMKLQDKFSELNLYEEIAYTSSPEEKGPFKPSAREKCPVCDEHVQSIEGSTMAQCGAGHFWELCSITRRVLFSPQTRKCVSCGAKSLQPSGDQSLTDTILTHCCKCVYCGGGLLNS